MSNETDQWSNTKHTYVLTYDVFGNDTDDGKPGYVLLPWPDTTDERVLSRVASKRVDIITGTLWEGGPRNSVVADAGTDARESIDDMPKDAEQVPLALARLVAVKHPDHPLMVSYRAKQAD